MPKPKIPPPTGKPYRRGVGIVLIDARGSVFVGRRIDTKPAAWQMPQGGIDDGESPRAAAMRELEEEIGTNKAQIIATTRTWLRYELPPALQRKVWGGKYRGQEQKWFLMRFLGRDADIDLATAQPEFSAWKWLPFPALPKVIVGFKRDLYLRVVDVFKDKVAAAAKRRVKSRKRAPVQRNKVVR